MPQSFGSFWVHAVHGLETIKDLNIYEGIANGHQVAAVGHFFQHTVKDVIGFCAWKKVQYGLDSPTPSIFAV